jgi:hypothetical protein
MATDSAKLFNRVAEVCFAGLLERDKLENSTVLANGHRVVVLAATPHHGSVCLNRSEHLAHCREEQWHGVTMKQLGSPTGSPAERTG